MANNLPESVAEMSKTTRCSQVCVIEQLIERGLLKIMVVCTRRSICVAKETGVNEVAFVQTNTVPKRTLHLLFEKKNPAKLVNVNI